MRIARLHKGHAIMVYELLTCAIQILNRAYRGRYLPQIVKQPGFGFHDSGPQLIVRYLAERICGSFCTRNASTTKSTKARVFAGNSF